MKDLTRKLATGAAGLAALVSASTIGNSAEIKPVPQEPVWIADGQTEYIVDIHVDNTGLGGAQTAITEWKFTNLPPFNYSIHELPNPEEDFFRETGTMLDWIFYDPSHSAGRLAYPTGPSDNSGNTARFNARVPLETPSEEYLFEFDQYDTYLASVGGEDQPVTLGENSVDVYQNHNQGFNTNMTGPVQSYTDSKAHEFYDFNGDGHVDLLDFAKLQITYPDCPE